MQAGFRQRRKQVHNGLTRELPVEREQVEEALAACAVDPERRPQTLSVDEWACLTGAARPAAVTPRLRLAAPAKLNLRLSVVGRRDDGFHHLDSTFVLVELADTLELTGGSGQLECAGLDSAGLTTGPDNLAWRGLHAALGDRVEEVRLELRKRIPLAAGLGGGSSDAAAAWRLGHAWCDTVPGTRTR